MEVSPLRFACPKVGKEGKAGEARIPCDSLVMDEGNCDTSK